MAVRPRRLLIAGLVSLAVVLLLGLGLVVGDGYAEDRVERAAAARLHTQLGTPAAPSVDVEGGPFLSQVVGRRLPRVHVVADQLGADGSGVVPVEHADLVLTDVTTRDWYQTLEAARAEGTAQLDYPALSRLAGVPLRPAGGGRVQLERSTSVFGVDVTARVDGTPRLDVDEQTLTLADPQIRVAGVRLPDAAAEPLLGAALQPTRLAGLPLGLRATSLTAADDAVHVGLRGEDVELPR